MPSQACVTHAEYESLEPGMSLHSVRALFDIDGHEGPDNATEFSWEFRTCWATGTKSVRVWFLLASGLTTRWLIVDA